MDYDGVEDSNAASRLIMDLMPPPLRGTGSPELRIGGAEFHPRSEDHCAERKDSVY